LPGVPERYGPQLRTSQAKLVNQQNGRISFGKLVGKVEKNKTVTARIVHYQIVAKKPKLLNGALHHTPTVTMSGHRRADNLTNTTVSEAARRTVCSPM